MMNTKQVLGWLGSRDSGLKLKTIIKHSLKEKRSLLKVRKEVLYKELILTPMEKNLEKLHQDLRRFS